jgi:hypothetical protein
MELGEYGMTYLLRLVACLFLCVSLNSFGALYGVHYEGTYSIDIASGQTSLITEDFRGYGDGISLAAVPLPAGIYLFLSGLVGLGFVKSKIKVSNFK